MRPWANDSSSAQNILTNHDYWSRIACKKPKPEQGIFFESKNFEILIQKTFSHKMFCKFIFPKLFQKILDAEVRELMKKDGKPAQTMQEVAQDMVTSNMAPSSNVLQKTKKTFSSVVFIFFCASKPF